MTRNEQIIHVWNLGAIYTGLAGTMTTELRAYTASTQFGPLTNTVTISELGTTGIYVIRYSPNDLNNYPSTWTLKVTAPTIALEAWYEDLVGDAPAPNAYCSLADVEALTQKGTYSPLTSGWSYTPETQPNDSEVRRFMENRAGIIYSWMVPTGGATTPGPTGWTVTIDTTTDKGLALNAICRQANAFGAAADALMASDKSPSDVAPLIPLFLEQFETLSESIIAAVAAYVSTIGNPAPAFNHYTEGVVTKLQNSSRPEQGLSFDSSTRW